LNQILDDNSIVEYTSDKDNSKESQNQWQEDGNRQPKWPLCWLFFKDQLMWRHDNGWNICRFALFMRNGTLQKPRQRSNYSSNCLLHTPFFPKTLPLEGRKLITRWIQYSSWLYRAMMISNSLLVQLKHKNYIRLLNCYNN
jgi:hypothetical protein